MTGGCPIRSGMTERSVPLRHIIDDSPNVYGDDCPATVVGVALPKLVSRESECSGAVEEISQLVSGDMAKGGVAGQYA